MQSSIPLSLSIFFRYTHSKNLIILTSKKADRNYRLSKIEFERDFQLFFCWNSTVSNFRTVKLNWEVPTRFLDLIPNIFFTVYPNLYPEFVFAYGALLLLAFLKSSRGGPLITHTKKVHEVQFKHAIALCLTLGGVISHKVTRKAGCPDECAQYELLSQLTKMNAIAFWNC